MHKVLILSTLAAALLAAAPASAEDNTTPDQLVDALNAVFGAHAGKRAAHTSGTCLKGSFTPTAEAPSYTKAKQFAGPVPVIARFSMGGGNPDAPNTQKDNARGFALHFDLGGGATSDMVMISAPVFLARSPEQFLTLLQTVASGDKDKIKAYFDANENSTRQGAWLNARPLPASYADVTYWGVHAFTLTNAKGEKRVIKWKVVPTGGEKGLSDEEAKGKAADFYTPELKERLAKGPVEFDIYAILGEPGDPEDDPTVLWPDDRKTVKLGTISITSEEDNKTCDANIFDPNNLADGIEGSATDTILPMRSADYAVSFSRRNN